MQFFRPDCGKLENGPIFSCLRLFATQARDKRRYAISENGYTLRRSSHYRPRTILAREPIKFLSLPPSLSLSLSLSLPRSLARSLARARALSLSNTRAVHMSLHATTHFRITTFISSAIAISRVCVCVFVCVCVCVCSAWFGGCGRGGRCLDRSLRRSIRLPRLHHPSWARSWVRHLRKRARVAPHQCATLETDKSRASLWVKWSIWRAIC